MMIDGIIPGSRASLIFDIVFVGMIVILPVLAYSIYLVKFKQAYALHKRIQITLGVVLLVVVTIFELSIRLASPEDSWRHDAAESPYYETFLMPFLYTHIAIAVVTIVLWVITIVGACKRYDSPPVPNAYSLTHKKLGIASGILMWATGLTGIAFYIMAFMMDK